MTHPPIGLSGFAKSGKTTAANYIEQEFGYKRLHIADPLREMLAVLLMNGFGMDAKQTHRYLEGDLKESIVPELGVTSRHAQITLGTEWGREQISPDLWVKAWKHRAQSLGVPAMNDSVRFPNEEDVIRSMNGFTMMIVRDGCGPAAFNSRVGKRLYTRFGYMGGVHPSERVDLLKPSVIIHNDSTVEALHAMIDEAMMLFDVGALRTDKPTIIRP